MSDVPAPMAPGKKGLSTGAIVGIVVGSVAVLGVIVLGILAAMAIPVFTSQASKAHDSYALADASTLGKEISLYFVDNNGPLSVGASASAYVLEDGNFYLEVPRSDGVYLGGSRVSGPTSWCVWVYAPDGSQATDGVRYSANDGQEYGNC